MANAHDRILAWCRSKDRVGRPCMRDGLNAKVYPEGTHGVLDMYTTEPSPKGAPKYIPTRSKVLAIGNSWDAVAAELGV